MAEPLKNFFCPALVARIAESIRAAHPAFSTAAFVRDACRGLGELELLDRAKHIAKAMRAHLPARYEESIAILVASLGEEHASGELEGAGMAPFFYLPHTIFVAEHGLEHFDLSMGAQHELTRRFTAEYCIRPYLERYPERTLAVLTMWTGDPNAHVRRLVSEGTRPRLPWAKRVRWLEDHPERVLPLLEALKDDPASLVRRSVANHLNDLSKIRPELVHEVCRRWLGGAGSERRALVEHALRSAVKRKDKEALGILGFGQRPSIEVVSVTFAPKRVAIGNKVRVRVSLRSRSNKAQDLAVDMAVHFVKAKGTGAKVFKLAKIAIQPGATADFEKSISLAVHTTRKPRPGKHAVDLLVNGETFPIGSFTVTLHG